MTVGRAQVPAESERRCPNCGADMTGRRRHVRFCSRDCQLAHLRAHGPCGYVEGTGDLTAWVGARIPQAVLDTIERLADEQGVTRPDWFRLAIGDRIERDTATGNTEQEIRG